MPWEPNKNVYLLPDRATDPIGGNWPYMVYKQYQSVTVVSDGQAYQIESVN